MQTLQYTITGKCKSNTPTETLTVYHRIEVEGSSTNRTVLFEQNKNNVKMLAEELLRSEYRRKKGKEPDSIFNVKVY